MKTPSPSGASPTSYRLGTSMSGLMKDDLAVDVNWEHAVPRAIPSCGGCTKGSCARTASVPGRERASRAAARSRHQHAAGRARGRAGPVVPALAAGTRRRAPAGAERGLRAARARRAWPPSWRARSAAMRARCCADRARTHVLNLLPVAPVGAAAAELSVERGPPARPPRRVGRLRHADPRHRRSPRRAAPRRRARRRAGALARMCRFNATALHVLYGIQLRPEPPHAHQCESRT